MNMLQTQAKFMSSCRVMELNIMENITIAENNQRTTGILVANGTTYTMRVLTISMDFPGGIFMNIEQIAEYSGE
jgi:membrane-bound ClpP family serine protease